MGRVMMGLLMLVGITAWAASAQAQARPLVMPVGTPAGPATWLFGQAYGNTPGAYNFGEAWYRAGQGLHFGIDLSMPCGTPLVAVADGVVAFADDLGFGSGPHNLILRHEALGITTLYGHLQAYPLVRPGQTVRQGDLVGYSGDPDVTCFSRPHLHFEVRSLDYRTAYNPIDWIEADWHALALVGAYSGHILQGDMDNPRRWMSLDNQPEVRFGGQRLNAYAAAYPPANGQSAPPNALPMRDLPAFEPSVPWQVRTLDADGCCWQNFWYPTEPTTLYSIDGVGGARAGIYRWDLNRPALMEQVESAPPAHRSPDGTHRIALDGSAAVITRQSDGAQWRVETGGRMPSLSPDNTRLLWVQTQPTVPGQARAQAQVYVMIVGGSAPTALYAEAGAGAQWVDNRRVLVSVPGQDRTTRLLLIDVDSGAQADLGTHFWLRGLSVGPGGQWALMVLSNQAEARTSGVYALRLDDSGTPPTLVGWFGGWRWRDADEVYVIPMEAVDRDPLQGLYHYELSSGALRRLDTPPFTVMNGDWRVSADGKRIVYRELSTRHLMLLERP